MIHSDWNDYLPKRERYRREGIRLVFANGCFDLLHPGHLRLLQKARALGDRLVVAINTDSSVRGNKGSGRPIVPEAERAEILAALEFVDDVVMFGEPTPREAIAAIVPDVLAKGADWGADAIVGREEVEAAGGRVERIEIEPGYSSTAIIERVRALNRRA
jgi:rfaE bifunctional protein nucleotidyltransferase chain/domain